ncbi:Flp pilus assembly complex ATPase component TadA [Kineosporia rhizophila]|uniref:CpaF family protein n=1 Tax=Kineosporia rhizophila TaxID=84633 RepID=UPI001E46A316|nr:ATPase, T2SS/T4P/T4SS family [Kineosporia rhizophila]MCE0536064.1 Flp pilus assembly complex ATPase component TadA [Kineosporia rhizophila]
MAEVPWNEGRPDHALVLHLQEQVADALTRQRQQRAARGEPELNAQDQRQLSLSLTRKAIQQHAAEEISAGRAPGDAEHDAALMAAVDAAIWGAGQLQSLLDDPLVENIDINGDQTFVTYADARGTRQVGPIAASDDELIAAVRTLGSHAGVNARPFDLANPELDLRLPDGSRLSALMGATERPLVSIRRNRYPQIFLDEPPAGSGITRGASTLTNLGTLTPQAAAFLKAAVQSRANIIVAGATDAGKTTLLRALIHCIPASERLVTVERALELEIGRYRHLHPNVAELEEVLPAADGSGGLGIGALVRRTRRMNPSRVIVGEVMGPEVVDMLSAMSQGNDGSLSTIHARSAIDVFDRLAVYAAQHGGLPVNVTHQLVGGAVDFVVFIRKVGRQRRVTEIVEVTGTNDGHVTRSRLFDAAPDGTAVRDPEVPIMRASSLATVGYDDVQWNTANAGPRAGWQQIVPRLDTMPTAMPFPPAGRSSYPGATYESDEHLSSYDSSSRTNGFNHWTDRVDGTGRHS